MTALLLAGAAGLRLAWSHGANAWIATLPLAFVLGAALYAAARGAAS